MHNRKLLMESLEARRLLAVDAFVEDGDLMVVGDDASEQVRVTYDENGTPDDTDDDQYLVQSGGTVGTFPLEEQVAFDADRVDDDIHIVMNGGGDLVFVEELPVPEDLLVETGDGGDIIAINNIEVGGDVMLIGGSGDDFLGMQSNFGQEDNAGDNQDDFLGVTIEEELIIVGAGGDDVVDIGSSVSEGSTNANVGDTTDDNVEIGGDVEIHTGDGDDTVGVSSVASGETVEAITDLPFPTEDPAVLPPESVSIDGDLSIHTGAGNDSVNIGFFDISAASDIDADDSTITADTRPTVEIDGDLEIETGEGDDFVGIASAANALAREEGMAGDDTDDIDDVEDIDPDLRDVLNDQLEAEIVAGAELFTVDLDPLNESGVEGEAFLTLSDDMQTLTVQITATGLVADMTHPQHIHGRFDGEGNPIDSVVPPAAADDNANGVIDVVEGREFYGPVILPLVDEPSGDFPTAPGGAIAFLETYDLSDESIFADDTTDAVAGQFDSDDLTPLELREIVLHGGIVPDEPEDGTDDDADDAGEYRASLPVAAGVITEVEDLNGDGITDGAVDPDFTTIDDLPDFRANVSVEEDLEIETDGGMDTVFVGHIVDVPLDEIITDDTGASFDETRVSLGEEAEFETGGEGDILALGTDDMDDVLDELAIDQVEEYKIETGSGDDLALLAQLAAEEIEGEFGGGDDQVMLFDSEGEEAEFEGGGGFDTFEREGNEFEEIEAEEFEIGGGEFEEDDEDDEDDDDDEDDFEFDEDDDDD